MPDLWKGRSPKILSVKKEEGEKLRFNDGEQLLEIAQTILYLGDMKKSWDLNNSTAQQIPNIKPGFVEKSPPPSTSKHNLLVDKKPENKANQGTKNSDQVILFKLNNLF